MSGLKASEHALAASRGYVFYTRRVILGLRV